MKNKNQKYFTIEQTTAIGKSYFDSYGHLWIAKTCISGNPLKPCNRVVAERFNAEKGHYISATLSADLFR